MCKKDYSWNPSTCICENIMYLKGVADDSVIVSTNVTSTIPTNAASTISLNSNDKKVTHERNNFLIHTISITNYLPIVSSIFHFYQLLLLKALSKKGVDIFILI